MAGTRDKTTPMVEPYDEISPVVNAMAPFTVAGVQMRASIVVNKPMPPVFSSTPMSTLTPPG